MRKLFIFHLILGLFALVSCKDEPKPEFFIDQDTKDFCVFKIGSWWLYEEETTMQRDCVWVTKSYQKKIGSNDRGINTGNIRNGYQIILSSTLLSKQNVNISCWAGGAESFPDKNIYQELITFPFALEDYTFLSTSDTSVKFEPYFGYKFQLKGEFKSYIIAGTVYKDVKYFNSNMGLHQSWKKNIFISKHTGKIRYEMDNMKWNLIKFNIVQ